MANNIVANSPVESNRVRPNSFLGRNLPVVSSRKRLGSLIFYAMAALILAVFCSIMFNFLDHNTEFAIAVMGSLIGGFLGALLAATLIVDIYSPNRGQRQEEGRGEWGE